MKKFRQLFISLILVGACSTFAYADTMSFTPLNFSDATYTVNNEQNTIAATETSSSTINQLTTQTITGSQNMQSAISQLDSAQVEVRNKLLKYKTQYDEVNEKYNTIKAERAELAKQVRACEKKIRQLDKAKEKIRKNME